MKISIFTATHDIKYLLDAYMSIKDQPYDEWLILLNGDAKYHDVAQEIHDDPRTQVVYRSTSGRVGDVKALACLHCTGDILVELDHDDLLIAPGIQRVREVFEDPEVVFAYSRFAEFNNADNSPREFGSVYGWKYTDFEYEGKPYRVPINPPIDPYHTSIIYFAPNHLRAWRRTAYEAVGGHNSMNVLDDADLIARLYTQGKFAEIEECCYLYRVHGDNSWLERSAEIQANLLNQRRQYLHGMVEHWARSNGHRMINLGGRFNNPAGYESVDFHGDPDVFADLSNPFPFEDSSIGVVRAFDFMEHLHDKMHVLSEIHRVLKPGGYLLSMTPSTTGPNGEAGMGADQDPTHVSRWNRNSFWYVTRREQAQYIDNEHVRFQPAILENCFPSQWHKDNLIPYVRADLVCLKDGYQPHGLVEV